MSSERSTEIIGRSPEGYPRCGGCDYVFEYDDEIIEHDCTGSGEELDKNVNGGDR